jgi:hypothetical protein
LKRYDVVIAMVVLTDVKQPNERESKNDKKGTKNCTTTDL